MLAWANEDDRDVFGGPYPPSFASASTSSNFHRSRKFSDSDFGPKLNSNSNSNIRFPRADRDKDRYRTPTAGSKSDGRRSGAKLLSHVHVPELRVNAEAYNPDEPRHGLGREEKNRIQQWSGGVRTAPVSPLNELRKQGLGRRPRALSSSTGQAPLVSSIKLQQLTLGSDASVLVGKTLSSIRRSTEHPTLFLNFTDRTAYQVLVAGYDPALASKSRSIATCTKRHLELDAFLDPLLAVGETTPIDLTITACATIRLVDKAYERMMVRSPVWSSTSSVTTTGSGSGGASTASAASDTNSSGSSSHLEKKRWDQDHMALAFKFLGVGGWHCVSAVVSECEEEDGDGDEIFRSYEDVYVKEVPPPPLLGTRSPRTKKQEYQRSKRRNSEWSWSSDARSENSV